MVQFKFTYDANVGLEQRIGFEMAAAVWSSYLKDNVTINLHVGATTGLNDGKAVGGAIPIFHEQTYGVFGEYYRQDATAAAIGAAPSADQQAVASLQQGNTVDLKVNGEILNGNTAILLTSAQAKALGMNQALSLSNGTTWDRNLLGTNALDGYIVINNSFEWNYDFTRSAAATEGTLDFLSMALHEIGHNLGFVSGLDGTIDIQTLNSGKTQISNFTALDLFRHTVDTASIKNPDGSVSSVSIGGNAYFSIDGGVTNLGNFSTGENTDKGGDGYQASHWQRLQNAMGIMDPTLAYRERLNLSGLDLRALDVLGWDVNHSVGSSLNTQALLLQAEKAVATSLGLDASVLSQNGTGGNLYTLGYSKWWQQFEGQMLELGYSKWWQQLEADMLNLGYSKWWQTLETHSSTLKPVGNSSNNPTSQSVIDYSNSDKAVVVTGGNADDILSGSKFRDLISGAAGDDLIDGKDGDDTLLGDEGNDILYGAAGNDSVYGGLGDDVLAGEAGDDKLFGEEGHDILSGGYGNDTLDGSAGDDLIKGDAGNDVLDGGEGTDELKGGEDNDVLIGSNGEDVLDGGSGNDVLYGDQYVTASTTGSSTTAQPLSLENISAQAGFTTAANKSPVSFWLRLEAEALSLKNFNIEKQTISSNGSAIATGGEGQANTKFTGPTGTYDIVVGYYDESDGKGTLGLTLGGRTNQRNFEWILDRNFNNNFAGNDNFVTRTIRGVQLKSGEDIQIKGKAEGYEFIRVDYIDVISAQSAPAFAQSEFYNGSLYVQSYAKTYQDALKASAALGGKLVETSTSSEQLWLYNTFGTTQGITKVDVSSSQFSLLQDAATRNAGKALRIEAESFNLSNGYGINANRGDFTSGKATIANNGSGLGKATSTFTGASGLYDIFVSYVDEGTKRASATFGVNGKTLDQWSFDTDNYLATYRSVGTQISLKTGDIIDIQGRKDGTEKAQIDYVDFVKTSAIPLVPVAPVVVTAPTSANSVPTGTAIFIEAENMQLSGKAKAEGLSSASNGGYAKLESDTASTLFKGETGYYDIVVGYYDIAKGTAELTVKLNATELDRWLLDKNLNSEKSTSTSNFVTRTVASGVKLTSATDVLQVMGIKDGDDKSYVDYIKLVKVQPPTAPGTAVTISKTTNGDVLRGGQGNDTLYGGEGNDNLYGGSGNDRLEGGIGDDRLDGSDAIARGALEQDILVGGQGADRFVLGDASGRYYAGAGNSDYALIKDFDAIADVLQLHGSASSYQQQLQGNNLLLSQGQELIAILENTRSLNFASTSVAFV